MKKVFRLTAVVAISLLLVVSMFAGCGNNATAPAPSAPAADGGASAPAAPADGGDSLAPVTLKLILFGDKRTETDNVFRHLADTFRAELNADYDVIFVPGGPNGDDYKDKLRTMAASGDDWDFNFDGDWLSYNFMINNNAYLDVKDLLPIYAPDLNAVYEKTGVLDSIAVGGSVYALPWTMSMNQRPFVQWSRDFADAAGLDFENNSIKTVEDMDALFTALRQAYPDKKINELAEGHRIFYAMHELTELPYNFVFDTKSSKPELIHFAMTDAYQDYAKWAKKWQDDGVIWRDIITTAYEGNNLIREGELISNISWHEWVHCNWMWNGVMGTPDVNRYYSLLYPENVFPNRTPLANVMAINRNAKNPERALMFLNMVETNREFYDMLHFGIEGLTYVLGPNGEAEYAVPDMTAQNSNYMEWGGQWALWKPQFMRPTQIYPEGFWQREAEFAALPINVNSPVVGFFPDLTSVENELAMVASIYEEGNRLVRAGLINDSEAAVQEMRNRLNAAGLDAVTAEYQKQVDAFMASK